jgi:hypothetical protein
MKKSKSYVVAGVVGVFAGGLAHTALPEGNVLLNGLLVGAVACIVALAIVAVGSRKTG